MFYKQNSYIVCRTSSIWNNKQTKLQRLHCFKQNFNKIKKCLPNSLVLFWKHFFVNIDLVLFSIFNKTFCFWIYLLLKKVGLYSYIHIINQRNYCCTIRKKYRKCFTVSLFYNTLKTRIKKILLSKTFIV